MKKYERLIEQIENHIKSKNYLVGERIPSVREMSKISGFSINTVLKAYETMEMRGSIITKPKSGYYVTEPINLKQVSTSIGATIPVNVNTPDLINLLMDTSRNNQIYQLGTAYLPSDVYPTKDIIQFANKIIKEFPDTPSKYEISPGSFEYRRQIARLLYSCGCEINSDQIIATNGGAEAISLALRSVCNKGDTVITESPLYFGTLQAMESLGLKVLEIQTCPRFGIDITQVKKQIGKQKIGAAVVMPNFSNPLGSLMADSDKKELINILLKFGIPIIEDDIFGEIPFFGDRPKPLRSFSDSELIITCSSFSKTVSPGLRIGWISPGKFYDKVKQLQLSSTLAAGSLSQKIIAQYLISKKYENNLSRLRSYCALGVNRTTQTVLNYFPEGTKVSTPKGGYLLWVELPSQIDSIILYKLAIQSNISFSPGVMFSAANTYRNYLRLNCANNWNVKTEESLIKLGHLAKTLI